MARSAGISTLFNRAKMSVSGTPGTGAITLGSAVTGFQTFAAAGVVDGTVSSYVIEDSSSTWEVGQGHYTASGTVWNRDIVTASSSSGSAISATSSAVVYLTALSNDLHARPFSPPPSSYFNYDKNDGTALQVANDPLRGLVMSLPGSISSGDRIRWKSKAISTPASSWQVTARLEPNLYSDNYNTVGICFYRDAGTIGSLVGLHQDATCYWGNWYLSGTGFDNNQWSDTLRLNPDFWVQVTYTYSTDTFVCGFSGDGSNWVGTSTTTSSSLFGGQADRVGIGFAPNRSFSGEWCNVAWWEDNT